MNNISHYLVENTTDSLDTKNKQLEIIQKFNPMKDKNLFK
jgi:hypothetical protein